MSEPFIDFFGLKDGDSVLDVGCGTGSLTRAIAAAASVECVTGIDPGEAYVAFAGERAADPRLRYRCADACELPFAEASFDRCVSQLVLNFIPEAGKAIDEMIRVARPEGTVAAAVWDVRGGLPAFQMFWDTVCAVDSGAAGPRDCYYSGPLTRPGELGQAFTAAGLEDVHQDAITLRMDFDRFADYWTPLLGKTGPAGAYLDSIDDALRADLEERVRAAYELGGGGGPRSFAAVAFICRGTVPA